MTTQQKSLRTHVITLLFIFFQFIQFIPQSLISSLQASAETNTSVTLFSDSSGTGKVDWSLSEDGKQITWDVTVTQNEREIESSPSVEVIVPQNIGPPQFVSATLDGQFQTLDNRYIFESHSYTTSPQTLTLIFTTSVNDLTSEMLNFKIGASIQEKETPLKTILESLSIPNKLAQLEKERIAAEEKAEAERIEAEKAAQQEADRLAAEKAEQEAEKEAEQKCLAEQEQVKKEAAELEAEKRGVRT